MDSNPARGGVRISIAWSGAGTARRRSLSFSTGEFLRVLLVLGLCVVSFGVGRGWRAPAARSAAPELIII